MIKRIATVLILIVMMVCPVAAEVELDENGRPVKNMLEAFEPYVGRWVGKFQMEATDMIPEAFEITGVQEGKYILDKTMFQMRTVDDSKEGTIEGIFLYGYDRLEQNYCCWHYQQGGLALKYKVLWAEDGKSYQHVLLDKEEFGYSVRTDVQLDDGKAIRWKSTIVTNDGDLLIDQTGELTPEKGEVNFPDPELKDDDKLSMYRPYEGKWTSVTKGKATEFVQEPYEVTGPWVQRNILGGDIVEMRGKVETAEQGYSYHWYYMFDVREDAYVAWFHDSRGVHTKSYGNWSEQNKQMTWTLDDPDKHGVMVTIVDDLSDPGKIAFTFKMESDEGKLIMEESGYATREGKAD